MFTNIRIVTPSELTGLWSGSVLVTTDAEWDYTDCSTEIKSETTNGKRSNLLTTQYFWKREGKRFALLIWKPDYELPDFTKMNVPDVDDVMVLVADPNKTNPYTLGMCDSTTKLNLLMFYAFMDVVGTVGRTLANGWLNSFKDFSIVGYRGDVSKKRKISGTMFTPACGELTLYDTIGMANSSLDTFMESIGRTSPFKKLSDGKDKGKMAKWVKEEPESFFYYAIGDVLYVEETVEKRVEQVNKMLSDAFGDKMEPYDLPYKGNKNPIPMSSGSLVSDTFNNWLETNPEYVRALTALLPFTTYETSENNLRFHNDVVVPIMDGLTIEKPLTKGVKNIYVGKTPTTGYHPISFNSIPAHLLHHKGNSGLFNAVVFGGRCVNESPDKSILTHVIDPDLSGCYGAALRDFTLPLGAPRSISYATKDINRMTLGDFMDAHEDNLYPGLWQVIVENQIDKSGVAVPFKHINNDVVFSKLDVTEASIRKNLTNDNDGLEDSIEMAHVDGDMKLLNKEVKNGVITADIWETLMSDTDVKAKKEWRSLRIITTSFHLKSDQITDVAKFERLCKRALNPDGSMKIDDNGNPIYPFYWFAVKLEGFVGAFSKIRKSYKSKKVTKGDHFDLLQNGVKLFINTTYGCLAAPYFKMGNTVVANNITARARIGVWMMAKALGSVQSITDGGIFSNDSVRYLEPHRREGKIPSFSSLADYKNTNQNRSIRVGKLFDLVDNDTRTQGGSIDAVGDCDTRLTWESFKQLAHEPNEYYPLNIDQIVTDHVNGFWKHYGLKLKFDIEVKTDNTADYAYYSGSGDYLLSGVKPTNTNILTYVHQATPGSKNPVVPETYIENNLLVGTAVNIKYRGCNDGFDTTGEVRMMHGKPFFGICKLNGLMESFTNSDGTLKSYKTNHEKQISIAQYRVRSTVMAKLDLTAGDSIIQPYEFSLNNNAVRVATEVELKVKTDTNRKLDAYAVKVGKVKGSRFYKP